jgi:branched-chain amino acid transport system ATP-binding protein
MTGDTGDRVGGRGDGRVGFVRGPMPATGGTAGGPAAPVLAVRGLVAGYGRIEVLHGVDMEVGQGQAVTVVGANGAGKSTLLKAVAGLLPARAGRVELHGRDVTGWPPERRARAGMALVPEGRQVFAGLSVRDNLLLGAYGRRAAAAETLAQVERLFPMLAERARQAAGTLSGGQQQMLAVGRALMGRPAVLLLDEPSLGLAPGAVREVVVKLRELAALGTTIVLVEQNAAAAFKVAERGYVLERGRLMLTGTTAQLSADPQVRRAYLGIGDR